MMRILEITTEELQNAMNKLKKKVNLQIAQESEQKDIKATTMRRETLWDKSSTKSSSRMSFSYQRCRRKWEKRWHTEKETWKMLKTTARSPRCQRCRNCSRQYCTADCTHEYKRKIRRNSEALAKRQTILRGEMWAAAIDFMKAFDSNTHK